MKLKLRKIFLLLMPLIISCSTEQLKLSRVKIIKHDELKINKKFSGTENKDEIENLKKEFNCNSITNPPDYFGGFSPNKDIYLCYSNEIPSMFPEGTIQYIFKDSDGKYKKELTLQKIFSPVNTNEEALSFALFETGNFNINDSKNEKDFINKGFLQKGGSSGSVIYNLKINTFTFGVGFYVYVDKINETFVKKNENGDYIVNLFYFQPNINNNSCRPALWEKIYKVSNEGKVVELSSNKIVEDSKIDDCVIDAYEH